MDMKISGSGSISSGEYENIRISGSGRLSGLVRCKNLSASGSAHGESIECENDMKISGGGRFTGNVTSSTASVSGAFSADGNVEIKEKLSCSGAAKIRGDLKCAVLSVSGMVDASRDIEAEKVDVDGILNCEGLVNAEEVTIKYHGGMDIGSIGGTNIVICRSQNSGRQTVILPLFASIAGSAIGRVRVKNSIEGDNIAIEGVCAERVSGRVVAIGENCKIDLVQYSEKIEVSPSAQIGRREKI